MKSLLSRNFCQERVSISTYLTVWRNEKSCITRKIFREINLHWSYLVKTLISRNFLSETVIQKFRKLHTVYLTLWKLRKFTATIFPQKFRESNFLQKKLYSDLIWRKIFAWQWISRFSTLNICDFHSALCEKTRNSLSLEKIRQINNLVISLVKPLLLSRNFCQKCAREFP